MSLFKEVLNMNRGKTLTGNNRLIFLSSLALLFFASGCVSSSQYKTLEGQHEMLQQGSLELLASNLKLNQELTQAKDQNQKLAQQKMEQEQTMNQMVDNLKTEVANKTVQINMIEETSKVQIMERLLFNSGSAKVNGKGRKLLARIAPTLKEAANQEICVVGHADQLPPGKKLAAKYPSNWELSTARATAIIQILQWGYKIDPKRLVAEGVAHYRPLVMETKKNRATNRVVEIILTSLPKAE
jgi:chemotaxis protein MotB